MLERPSNYLVFEMRIQNFKVPINFDSYNHKIHTLNRLAIPMGRVDTEIKNLRYVFSDIGGVWTAINVIAFIFLTSVMYRKMLQEQAAVIKERKKEADLRAVE